MLRKTVHIIITALLFTATTGFTVSKHYCGDTLVLFSLYTHSEACCEDISDECCHDVSEHFQVEQEFVATSFSFEKDTLLALKSVQSVIDFQIPETNSGKTAFAENTFPHKTKPLLASLQKYLL